MKLCCLNLTNLYETQTPVSWVKVLCVTHPSTMTFWTQTGPVCLAPSVNRTVYGQLSEAVSKQQHRGGKWVPCQGFLTYRGQEKNIWTHGSYFTLFLEYVKMNIRSFYLSCFWLSLSLALSDSLAVYLSRPVCNVWLQQWTPCSTHPPPPIQPIHSMCSDPLHHLSAAQFMSWNETCKCGSEGPCVNKDLWALSCASSKVSKQSSSNPSCDEFHQLMLLFGSLSCY